MKHWNVPFGLIAGLIVLCAPLVARAHPAHGDTVVHALLHMLQTNGIWLGLLFVAALWSLRFWAKRRLQIKKVSPHDPR